MFPPYVKGQHFRTLFRWPSGAEPRSVLRARAIAGVPSAGLLVMICLGVVSTLLIQRFGVFSAILLAVLIPLVLWVLPPALSYALRRLAALRRELAWWHGLWLALLLSALVFRIRDVQAIRESPLDAWAIYRVTLVAGVALVLGLRLALRMTDCARPLVRGLVGGLAIHTLIALASTLWSVYPAWTLYKSCEFLVDLALLGAVLASVPSTGAFKSLFDWTWLLFGGLLVTVWAGAILAPDRAFIPGSEVLPWRILGVLPALDQNSVGDLAAILAIVGLTRLLAPNRDRRARSFHAALFVASLATLVLSQTRAAIVGFLVAAFLVLLFSRRLGTIVVLALVVVLLLSLSSASNLLTVSWQRGDRPEELENFSGRYPLWEALWRKFQQSPWIGFGAYAGTRFASPTVLEDTSLSSALNSYLEVALGTGLLGLVPLLLVLAGTWWTLVRAVAKFPQWLLERRLAVEALGALAVVMVRSFFTVQFVWHPALEFLLVLGFAEFLRRTPKSVECLGEA